MREQLVDSNLALQRQCMMQQEQCKRLNALALANFGLGIVTGAHFADESSDGHERARAFVRDQASVFGDAASETAALFRTQGQDELADEYAACAEVLHQHAAR